MKLARAAEADRVALGGQRQRRGASAPAARSRPRAGDQRLGRRPRRQADHAWVASSPTTASTSEVGDHVPAQPGGAPPGQPRRGGQEAGDGRSRPARLRRSRPDPVARVAAMAAVLEFADVTVRRGRPPCSTASTGRVEEDERWVILGPNGAGKTTLLQVAAAQIHPTDGRRRDPRRGARHRRRLRAAAAHRPDQRRRSPSGSRARETRPRRGRLRVVRRGRPLARGVRRPRPRPRRRAARRARRRAPARPHLRHPQRGRAQARADRPRADDRPRAAAARRAGRRASTSAAARTSSRRCRCWPWTRTRRPRCWSPTTSRRSRRASPTRCCCATGQVVAAGPLDEVITEARPLGDVRDAAACCSHEDGRWAARRRVAPAPR